MNLSEAQQRVVDYLKEHAGFVYVPPGVCNDLRTFDWLELRGIIESEAGTIKTPRANEHVMLYRIKS